MEILEFLQLFLLVFICLTLLFKRSGKDAIYDELVDHYKDMNQTAHRINQLNQEIIDGLKAIRETDERILNNYKSMYQKIILAYKTKLKDLKDEDE